MISYTINDLNSEVITEVKIWEDPSGVDLSVSFNIAVYSMWLLDQTFTMRLDVISSFDRLDTLREWIHDKFLVVYADSSREEKYNAVVANVKKGMQEICATYGLIFVEECDR